MAVPQCTSVTQPFRNGLVSDPVNAALGRADFECNFELGQVLRRRLERFRDQFRGIFTDSVPGNPSVFGQFNGRCKKYLFNIQGRVGEFTAAVFPLPILINRSGQPIDQFSKLGFPQKDTLVQVHK